MKNSETALPPPMLLAITYAPAAVRARLAWLLALDQRLSDVLNRASEPMIAQLRLSWWRDALKCAPDKRPKGEPLFAALAEIGADRVAIKAGLSLVDAFEILAIDTDSLEQDIAWASRITAICKAYALWAGCSEPQRSQVDQIAEYWGNPTRPLPKSLPRISRPLSILALAERLGSFDDANSPPRRGLRLNWHALTGR